LPAVASEVLTDRTEAGLVSANAATGISVAEKDKSKTQAKVRKKENFFCIRELLFFAVEMVGNVSARLCEIVTEEINKSIDGTDRRFFP